MMNTYARIQDGRVAEIIEPLLDENGNEFPISDRFTAEIVATLVDISSIAPGPVEGMVYYGSAFSQYIPPALTPVEILATNTEEQSALMSAANSATSGMSDAFVAGLLSDADTAKFKAWAAYKLTLSKVDCSVAAPSWPAPPAQ